MKMLKKIGAVIICAAMLGLTACGGTSETTTQTSADTSAADQTTAADSTAETEETAEDNTAETEDMSDTGTPHNMAGKTSIRIGTLKGPTGMGMAKLIEDNSQGEAKNSYSFTVAGAPDDITAGIISGDLDIAAVPTNLASVLYAKTEGEVQLLALNTLGVLYVLENGDTINSIEDLKGKTVYATGQGSTPEYVLNYILTKNGIDPENDVEIVYLAEHAELASQMTSGDVAIGMLPVPNVTSVLMSNPDVRIALNLTEEWNKVAGEDSVLSMGCVIVNKKFAEENKEAVNTFLDEYKASIEFANSNIEEAAEYMERAEIIPKKQVAMKAIPDANITFVEGEQMKTQILNFYQVLFDANPKAIGGAIPDDNFFYER
ncbi:MAG: ABC transporter substrate-binding protein [Ruminiclostridium sp.]